MFSNIKVYQKYIVASIIVGSATRSLYARSGPKAEGVPTNNQRGGGSGPCRLWGGLYKARHILPTALLVRVQRFRNDLYDKRDGFNFHITNFPFLSSNIPSSPTFGVFISTHPIRQGLPLLLMFYSEGGATFQ